MAITRIATRNTGVGDAELSAQRNNLLYEVARRKYVLEFVAISDSFRISQYDILIDPLVPKLGDTFTIFGSNDALATCVSVVPQRTLNPYVWYIKCTYDTDRLVSQFSDNPLNQPPEIDYGAVTIMKPMFRDITGTLIESSAHLPFDPPILYPYKRITVRIIQNQDQYDALQGATYTGATNADVVGIWAPYTVRCLSRNGRRMLNAGILYYQVTTELEIDPNSYAEFILDQSYRDIDGVLFRDPLDFSLPGNPTLLNGLGRALRTAKSTVALAMNNVTTTLRVDADRTISGVFPQGPTFNGLGVMLPPNPYYFVQIEDEIMKVVSRTAFGALPVELTVQRGQAGTTAVAHAFGAIVKMLPYFRFYYPIPAYDFANLNLPPF